MSTICVKPITESDIDLIIDYLYGLKDEHYNLIGANKNKLPSKSDFKNNLRIICNTPLTQRESSYMIWFFNNKPIGHIAIKDIVFGEIAHMHLHMWNSDFKGKGYGSKLFCMSVIELYQIYKLKMILCEPSATNDAPNRMLNKIGFKKWKTYISTSTEISLTCTLNSYIIDKSTAEIFLCD